MILIVYSSDCVTEWSERMAILHANVQFIVAVQFFERTIMM